MNTRGLSLGAAIFATLLCGGGLLLSPVLLLAATMGGDKNVVGANTVFAGIFALVCVGLPVTSWVARARGRYRLSLLASSIPIGLFGLVIGLQILVLIALGVLMNLHH